MKAADRRRHKRKRAYRAGRMAEWAAAVLLVAKGYRIIARNVKTPQGEIDIIARRGPVLAIVEVKARQAAETAAESVSRRQQRRIARATEAFLGRRGDLSGLMVRFDAVLVAPRALPRHLPDAWRP